MPLIPKEEFAQRYTGKHCQSLSWNAAPTDIGGGRSYVGEFTKEGSKKPEGLCIITFSDGSEYRGLFSNDTFNGRG